MTYLVAAYAAVWCLIFLYLYTLRSRQKSLEKTLQALQKSLEKV